MPTKSNNIGGRGGARAGAGAKKKPLSEKIEAGNQGGKKLKVLDLLNAEKEEMPEPHVYLSARQGSGESLGADEIYKEAWEWLDKVGCTALISPQLLERYAVCAARWMQCEEKNNSGLLASHPTTGNPIASPYVNIGINYLNQANRLWNEIFQIVKENCAVDFSGTNPQGDMMESLLRKRNKQARE